MKLKLVTAAVDRAEVDELSASIELSNRETRTAKLVAEQLQRVVLDYMEST